MDLRVAAYAVIHDDERGGLLLAHWNEGTHASWTLPGGGLEDGEDPQDAVRREVLEETGYTVEVQGLLGIHSRVIPARQRIHQRGDTPLHTIRIIYRARVTGGDLRDEVGGSTDRAAWFPLSEVAALPHVQLIDIALEMDAAHPPAIG